MPIEKWTALPVAWFLLSEVSSYLAKAVDWEFLHHHWQLLNMDGMGVKIQGSHIQGDIYDEEEDIKTNFVSWARDLV